MRLTTKLPFAAPGDPSDATPKLPIVVSKATVVVDYSRSGPVKATLEGFLKDTGNNYVLDIDAEMIARAQDGKKYRLVPVEASP